MQQTMPQNASQKVITVGIGLGIGYALIRGNSLIKRPIHSNATKTINVTDTRGEPVMDTKWCYKSRDKSTETLQLTYVPVKPLSENASQKSTDQTNFDVLIIGGAAAGLSCAACCQKEGLSYLVIEKNENVGDIWLSRYHRLHLHDIIDNCHLPYMNMPDTYPIFPSRNEFATYLEEYKKTLNLNVQTCSIVKHAERINKNDIHSGWIITVQNEAKNGEIKKLKCKHLVMACGVLCDAKILKFPGIDKFKGLIVHSTRYTNGTDLGLKNKKVLVIGWGNSGSEISLDLLEHGAKPTLLIRSGQVIVPHNIIIKVESLLWTHLKYMVKIPFGYILLLPMHLFMDFILKIVCRFYYGNLSKYGIIVHSQGMMKRFISDAIAPLIDVGTIAAIKDGSINVINSEINKCNEDSITFKNGLTEKYDAVVLATGYQIFTAHRHWLDENDKKLIGCGKVAFKKHKMLPGSNFKQLPTLWYCFGNLLMINIAARIQTARIRDSIKKDNRNKIAVIKFIFKQIVKHIIAGIVIRKLWILWKSKR
eukprot:209957_1